DRHRVSPRPPKARCGMNAFSMPERIETERLNLVQWRREHFEVVAEFNRDRELTRFVGGVMRRGDAFRAFLTFVGHWSLRGYGPYAVENKYGEIMGQTGLFNPAGWPELELAYDFARIAHGRGYATEAARAVRDVAAERGLTFLVSLIHPDNTPSVRVAERLGAVPANTIELMGAPVVRFVHTMTPAGEPGQTLDAEGH
ncbi:MAG: GNAT family N-acetyltransferase, partial [Pseudomonadota bacterium]